MRAKKTVELRAVDEKVGLRWRLFRQSKGLSLEESARQITDRGYPCDRNTINRLETGRCQPQCYNAYLIKACLVYNRTPNEIFAATVEVS